MTGRSQDFSLFNSLIFPDDDLSSAPIDFPIGPVQKTASDWCRAGEKKRKDCGTRKDKKRKRQVEAPPLWNVSKQQEAPPIDWCRPGRVSSTPSQSIFSDRECPIDQVKNEKIKWDETQPEISWNVQNTCTASGFEQQVAPPPLPNQPPRPRKKTNDWFGPANWTPQPPPQKPAPAPAPAPAPPGEPPHPKHDPGGRLGGSTREELRRKYCRCPEGQQRCTVDDHLWKEVTRLERENSALRYALVDVDQWAKRQLFLKKQLERMIEALNDSQSHLMKIEQSRVHYEKKIKNILADVQDRIGKQEDPSWLNNAPQQPRRRQDPDFLSAATGTFETTHLKKSKRKRKRKKIR